MASLAEILPEHRYEIFRYLLSPAVLCQFLRGKYRWIPYKIFRRLYWHYEYKINDDSGTLPSDKEFVMGKAASEYAMCEVYLGRQCRLSFYYHLYTSGTFYQAQVVFRNNMMLKLPILTCGWAYVEEIDPPVFNLIREVTSRKMDSTLARKVRAISMHYRSNIGTDRFAENIGDVVKKCIHGTYDPNQSSKPSDNHVDVVYLRRMLLEE